MGQPPHRRCCHPEGFERDPKLVVDFYNERRAQAATTTPNPAHEALARLEAEHKGDLLLVTQNVDDLHERGGSNHVLHMHGALNSALCATCEHRWPAPMKMAVGDACPNCAAPMARPDIVWFGEMPYQMDRIERALAQADLFVAIGTSGNVYPAAGFVQMAAHYGAHTIELNLEPSAVVFPIRRNPFRQGWGNRPYMGRRGFRKLVGRKSTPD